MNTKTLKYFGRNQTITIECDASSTGLGAAVFQDNKIIGYASRTLNKTEKNFAMIEKELLAIVFACVRFDQIIVGNGTTIIKTDHKPLINIFNKPLLNAPKRLQLMLMILQRYDLEVMFVKGKDNVVADALSRATVDERMKENDILQGNVYNVITDEVQSQQVLLDSLSENLSKVNLINQLDLSNDIIEKIKVETRKDISIQQLIDFIIQGWPHHYKDIPNILKCFHKFNTELSYHNELVYRNNKVLIPEALRKNMVDRTHTAHNGIEASIKLAKDNFFWPGMTSQIKNKVKECSICMKFSRSNNKPPMQSHEVPRYPFQYVSMDVMFMNENGIKHRILITVDHYSDFFEIDFLPDMTPRAIINACRRNFSRHGIPKQVCCDNGTNFMSKQFIQFAKEWNFNITTSSPYHQQANGKAEATVKIVKNLMLKAKESNQDMFLALLHHRNTPIKMNTSPVQRIFSRRTRSSMIVDPKNLEPEVIKNVEKDIETKKRLSKHYYDRKTRMLPELIIGQPVFVQLRPEGNKRWLQGTIKEKLSERSYNVSVNGKVYRRDIINIKPEYQTRDIVNNQYEEQESNRTDEENEQSSEEGSSTYEDANSEENEDTMAENNEQPEMDRQEESPRQRPRRNIKLPEKFTDFIMN